ncbi:MAG: hypothetical protein ACPL5I_14615 [Thermodesulfobacteriota bacterium]
MEEKQLFKIIPLPKGPINKARPAPDQLVRFSGVILNLTSHALDCLQGLTRREMEKKNPSVKVLEEYYLLYHYLDFMKRLCLEKGDKGIIL